MAKTKRVKVDAQGRVLIPPHIRKELGLNAGQVVEVSLEDGIIQILPTGDRCYVCGESGADLIEVTIGPGKKHICNHCANVIARATKPLA